jgi:hypothetical protein
MIYTNWRKSTYSLSNGNCVEVGTGQALVAVRDSRDPDGSVIDVSLRAWLEFTEHVKHATSGTKATTHQARGLGGL